MAMLAERRERKRYNLVRRGKALYEDGNRFGTRMLEKMGWEKGKGLGANEDGQTDFVRLRYKHDNEGLGFKDRNDQWTQHENGFDGLLQTLNGVANTSYIEEAADEEVPTAVGFGFQKEPKPPTPKASVSGESLEEKSKKSRARVHYMKFTRGKDISRYSEKDLANIFGRKTLSKENCSPLEGESANVSTDCSRAQSDNEETSTPSFGVTTIRCAKSIDDYFKAKMALARDKLGVGQIKCNENDEVAAKEDPAAGGIDCSVEPEPDKVKKKSSRKAKPRELEVDDEVTNEGKDGEKNEDTDNGKSVKKKKKYMAENEKNTSSTMDRLDENQTTQPYAACDETFLAERQEEDGKFETTIPKKKSKRKDKNFPNEDNNSKHNSEEEHCENQDLLTKYVGKPKNRQKHAAAIPNLNTEKQTIDEEFQVETVDKSKSKIKKSKRKIDAEILIDPNDESSPALQNSSPVVFSANEVEANTQEESLTSKRKSKVSDVSNPEMENSLCMQNEDADTSQRKRKKAKNLTNIDNCGNVFGLQNCTEEALASSNNIKPKPPKDHTSDIQGNDLSLVCTREREDAAQCSEKKKTKKSRKSKTEFPIEESIQNIAGCENIKMTDPPTEIDQSTATTHNISSSVTHIDLPPAPPASTISQSDAQVQNEFRFPELNRRKRKKKSNTNSSIDRQNDATNNEEVLNYKLSGYRAEKFFNVDMEGFLGSNLADLIGYGLSGRLNLEIQRHPGDELRIQKFYAKDFNELRTTKAVEREKLGLKRKKTKWTSFPENLI